MTNNRDLARGAGLAGALLLAMPVLDLIVRAGSVRPVHVVLGTFGLVLFALAAKANAGKEA
jgi:hypothetical protein